MMLTVAYKRLIAQCSSGLSKVIIFAEGFVRSYNYFAVTRLQDMGGQGLLYNIAILHQGVFGPFTVCSLE